MGILKLGWLQIRILLMLKNEPLHGYEIANRLEQVTGRRLNPGTIYPTLGKLRKAKLIAGKEESGRAAPRIVYTLTEKGEKELNQVSRAFFGLFSNGINKEIANYAKRWFGTLLPVKEEQRILYSCLDMPEMYKLLLDSVGKKGKIYLVPRFPAKGVPKGIEVVKKEDIEKLRDIDYAYIADGIEPLLPELMDLKDLVEKVSKILSKDGDFLLATMDTENIMLKILMRTLMRIPLIEGHSQSEIRSILSRRFEIVNTFDESGFIIYLCRLKEKGESGLLAQETNRKSQKT